MTDLASIEQQLGQLIDPVLGIDYISAGVVKGVEAREAGVVIDLVLPYPCQGLTEQITQQITAALSLDVTLHISSEVHAYPVQHQLPNMKAVKNIIAVASGKGGVGKSTTTVNLALAMAAEGARVGILDADIYGPSLGQMMGVQPGIKPRPEGQHHMHPIDVLGVQTMSMAYLVDENTPMVWRGPMVSGALQQILIQTLWRDLDFLFIDMPPGTGDIQLTLSQKVPVAGAVIVTTPQDIALLDAKKGIEMFAKVDIPVLGVVENMSTHICENCGHESHLFGEGGGVKIAEQYHTEVLGQLPLNLSVRKQADEGLPVVKADPQGDIAARYTDIARGLSRALFFADSAAAGFPDISIEQD